MNKRLENYCKYMVDNNLTEDYYKSVDKMIIPCFVALSLFVATTITFFGLIMFKFI